MIAYNHSEAGGHDGVLSFAMEYLWVVMCRFYGKGPTRAKHVDVDQSDVVELRHEYSKEFWRMAQKSKGSGKEWASADLFWCALHALMVAKPPKVRVKVGTRLGRLNARGCFMPLLHPTAPQDMYLLKVYHSLLLKCHLLGSTPPVLHLTYQALRGAQKVLKNYKQLPQGLKLLAPKVRCADFYFAAILTLVEARVLRGEIRRLHRAPHVDPKWATRAKGVAMKLGLLSKKPLSKHTRDTINIGKTLQVAPMAYTASNCCVVVENPTGMLEHQSYMQPFSASLLHVTYCAFGARVKKPTSLWVHGFTWPTPSVRQGGLMCKGKHLCPAAVANGGKHAQVCDIPLHERVCIPVGLTTSLLAAMLAVN